MEGRDLNDHGDDLSWFLNSTNPPPPPSSQPRANDNLHSKENNNFSLNPTSQPSQYLRYHFYQNPNPLSYFVQNPNLQNPTSQNQPTDLFYPGYPYSRSLMEHDPFVHGQNPENGLRRPLHQSAPAPAPPSQYQYPGFDQFVHGLSAENGSTNPSFDQFVHGLGAENSLSGLNQSVPVPQYSLTNSSPTSFPLQNYETLDLQSHFEKMKIGNGFPLQQRSDQCRNIEPNYGRSAALFSRYNNFDVRPRPNCVNYSSIKELKGRICLVAKDEQGCRFLQKKIDERNPIDIEIIFSEVKDDLHELMRDQFANYLIQKLIGVLNEEQMTILILSIVNSQQRLFRICDDLIGSRVIQKLLDEYPQRQPLTPQQKTLIVLALKNITLTLSKSMHGNHVIKRCLENFPYEYTKHFVEEVAENCLNLATDKSGCCLLQHCIKYSYEEQKGRLIANVISNALFLSDHSYGNYAVQYILGLKLPQLTADVVAKLAGNYFTLSQGKCSSHVVENCLLESGVEQSTSIINEIIQHPDILELMLHPYGNFVIQTAWLVSQGRRIRQSVHSLVEMNSPILRSHIYGKKVLAKVRGNNCCFYKRTVVSL